MSRRLETIPGVGLITATAIAATVTNPGAFRSGRELAAWIGLVPRQSGTGGKVHLGRISKRGDAYLRRLLVLGATAVVRYARGKPEKAAWVNALPAPVVAVANKLARTAWALLTRGGTYQPPRPAAGGGAGSPRPPSTPADPPSRRPRIELQASPHRYIFSPACRYTPPPAFTDGHVEHSTVIS